MTRKQVVLTWLALIGLAILLFFPKQNEDHAQPVLLQGKTMGTTFNIKLYPTQEQLASNNLFELVNGELENVNSLMSTYKPDSELSLLNKAKAGESQLLSGDTIAVLNESMRLYNESNGAFDPTVGPMVNLWGFGPDGRVVQQPEQELIDQTRNWVGMDLLTIAGNSVTKAHDDLYVDFSSIAKGYGVDQVANALEKLGIFDYLVEVGGEMRLSGSKPNGEKWAVAIEKPVSDRREVQLIVRPVNLAMATSGDYRNYFEENGVRYSHTIDPTTGKPITHKLVSVTVMHPSAMTADAAATMLNVMGPEKAMEYAERTQLPVYLIVKSDQGFTGMMSSEFKKLFPEEKG